MFRRLRPIAPLIVTLIAAPVLALAPSVVKTQPALSVDKVRQGSSFRAALVLTIDPAYHINSNRPSDPNFVATVLTLDKQPGVTLGLVTYPRASLKKFEFSDKPLSVFQGTVVLKLAVTASHSLSLGAHDLKGKLTFQACNDTQCLIPRDLPIDIPFEVVSSDTKVSPANQGLFGTGTKRH